MIIEHKVNGNKNSTFHSFILSQTNMNITVSKGEYYRAGQTLVSSSSPTSIDIPVPTEDAQYEIWLTTEGIHIYVAPANQPIDIDDTSILIDKLAWFIVPNGTTSLDNIEVNALRMVQV